MGAPVERATRFPVERRIFPELYPERAKAIYHMATMTRLTAELSAEIIGEFTPVPEGQKLSDRRKKTRSKILDSLAAEKFEEYLAGLDFIVDSAGSEGLKELHKMGEAMRVVLGEHGRGEKKLTIVNDVVEGTTAAAHNRPGAISVLAASTYGGLFPTPENVNYMEKFFAPPKVKGEVDIKRPIEENLEVVRSAYGIPAGEIIVFVMNPKDRPTNQRIADGIAHFGARIIALDAGDLVPSFLAVSGPEYNKTGVFLVAGRGGFEEGVIGAAAGKALGGHVEGRLWIPNPEDKKFPVPNLPYLSEKQLVPGRVDQTFVTFTTITDDPWFGIPGVQIPNGTMTSHSMLIDNTGISITPQTSEIK